MSRVHIFLILQSSLKISICFKRRSMFLWQRKLFVSLHVCLPGSYLLSTLASHQPSSSVLWAQGCSSTDLIRSDYIFLPYSILSGPDGSLYMTFPTLMGTDFSMLWLPSAFSLSIFLGFIFFLVAFFDSWWKLFWDTHQKSNLKKCITLKTNEDTS